MIRTSVPPAVPIAVLETKRAEKERERLTAPDRDSIVEGSMDAADPAGSSHRARSASEAEPALRCEASARGVRRLANYE